MQEVKSFVPFIVRDDQGVLRVHPEGAEFLKGLVHIKKLGLVGATGVYRQGKSQILNLSILKNKCFPTGNTTTACTKGILIATIVKETPDGLKYLCLDCEGNGSTASDFDKDLDFMILMYLLTSVFIYNSSGAIEHQSLSHLGVISTSVQKLQNVNKDICDRPHFVWLLRNFHLELRDNEGKETSSADTYVQSHLLPSSSSTGSKKRKSPSRSDSQSHDDTAGEKENEDTYHELKTNISRSFESIHGFIMSVPSTNPAVTHNLYEHATAASGAKGGGGKGTKVNVKFLREVDQFGKLIDRVVTPKNYYQRPMSGLAIVEMAERYVSTLNKKEIPVLKDHFQLMNELSCKDAMDEVRVFLARVRETSSSLLKTHPVLPEDLTQFCSAQMTTLRNRMKEVVFDPNSRHFVKQLQLLKQLTLPIWNEVVNENNYAHTNFTLTCIKSLVTTTTAQPKTQLNREFHDLVVVPCQTNLVEFTKALFGNRATPTPSQGPATIYNESFQMFRAEYYAMFTLTLQSRLVTSDEALSELERKVKDQTLALEQMTLKLDVETNRRVSLEDERQKLQLERDNCVIALRNSQGAVETLQHKIVLQEGSCTKMSEELGRQGNLQIQNDLLKTQLDETQESLRVIEGKMQRMAQEMKEVVEQMEEKVSTMEEDFAERSRKWKSQLMTDQKSKESLSNLLAEREKELLVLTAKFQFCQDKVKDVEQTLHQSIVRQTDEIKEYKREASQLATELKQTVQEKFTLELQSKKVQDELKVAQNQVQRLEESTNKHFESEKSLVTAQQDNLTLKSQQAQLLTDLEKMKHECSERVRKVCELEKRNAELLLNQSLAMRAMKSSLATTMTNVLVGSPASVK